MSGTYSLKEIKELIKADAYVVTGSAADSARADFNFDETQILEVVNALSAQDFYKTMEAEKKPELYQDVYKPILVIGRNKIRAYVKVQIVTIRKGEHAVVISFKKA